MTSEIAKAIGLTPKSAREHVMFFYDEDLLPVKWRNFKVHFSVRETSRGDVRMPGHQEVTGYVMTPTYAWIFEIANDPKELWNIGLANTWVGVPVAKITAQYAASLNAYPNIKPGAEGPGSKR